MPAVIAVLGAGGALFERVLVDSSNLRISPLALWSDLLSGSQFHSFVVLPAVLAGAWMVAATNYRPDLLVRWGSRWTASVAALRQLVRVAWPTMVAVLIIFGLLSVGAGTPGPSYPIATVAIQVVLQAAVTLLVVIVSVAIAGICRLLPFGAAVYSAFFALAIIWVIATNVGLLHGPPFSSDSYLLAPRNPAEAWCMLTFAVIATLLTLTLRALCMVQDDRTSLDAALIPLILISVLCLSVWFVVAAVTFTPGHYQSLAGAIVWLFSGQNAPTIIYILSCSLMLAPVLWWQVKAERELESMGQRLLRRGSFLSWSIRQQGAWAGQALGGAMALFFIIAAIQLLKGWPIDSPGGPHIIHAVIELLAVAATVFGLTCICTLVFLLSRSGVIAWFATIAFLIATTAFQSLWGWFPFSTWAARSEGLTDVPIQLVSAGFYAVVTGIVLAVITKFRMAEFLEKI